MISFSDGFQDTACGIKVGPTTWGAPGQTSNNTRFTVVQ